MKLSIKSLIVFCLLLIGNNTVSAQDFQGKVYYQSKRSIDMSAFGGSQMSEERKKQIAERMKSMYEKTYVLSFNKSESHYKEDEVLEAPGQGGGRWSGMMSSFSAGPIYKNVKENSYLQQQDFFGKIFLIKETLPKFEWKMGSETKQIGKYMCFKATTTHHIDNNAGFGRGRRGRNNANADSTKTAKPSLTKEVQVTAWYTMQIPISQGPGEYWGLPGLILELNADDTTVYCSKIIMNPNEKETIKAPSKGKEITKNEYREVVRKKTEEMSQMWRGGRGGRGGRRGGF